MHQKRFFVMIAIASLLFINSREINSQSAHANGRGFEVGAQFSVIRLTSPTPTSRELPRVPCAQPPCPTYVFANGRAGFGGRFAYNFSQNVALEAEGNFFPQDRELNNGRKLQALFGVKAGKRFDKAGLFAKARPGFVRYEKGDYRPTPGLVCAATDPPPLACFTSLARTRFAFDLGGVVEFYPSRHTIIRFDAGDTIIRFEKRQVAVFGAGDRGVIPVTAETTNNFQASVGIGYRF